MKKTKAFILTAMTAACVAVAAFAIIGMKHRHETFMDRMSTLGGTNAVKVIREVNNRPAVKVCNAIANTILGYVN